MRRARLREVKEHAQGHSTEIQTQVSSSGPWTHESDLEAVTWVLLGNEDLSTIFSNTPDPPPLQNELD